VPGTEAPALSVVVPVFRNATAIAELWSRLDRALSPLPYELLFVDDASPDGASAEIRRLTAADPHVRGLRLPENVGQNAAVVAGLARARGETIAVMDGDGQDPPEAVPLLLEALARHDADVVFATRRGRYEALPRLVTGRMLKWSLWLLTRGKVPRDAGLFLVMRRAAADLVVAHAGSDPYVLVLAARAARTVATVSVERAPAGPSSYTSRMRWRVARRALATALRR
jgi:glycosyltransferase involved in cell wall biosynthesis